MSEQQFDESKHPRGDGGKWATKPASEADLDLGGGVATLTAPATPAEVTDEHLRDAMETYLKATSDYRDFDEWADELDYEDDDFGGQVVEAVQALSYSNLPGTSQAAATADAETNSVDVGVYDPVNHRHCMTFHGQYEFWSGEDAEPMERADYLMRRAYAGVVRQQNLVDDQRDRDTRLATMQRSMTWQILPPNDTKTKRDTLKAAYPGLSDDEALIGFGRLTDARDEVQRHQVLADLQTTSDERTMKQAGADGLDPARESAMADSRDSFSRAMHDSGVYRRSVAKFVGANLSDDDIEKLCTSEHIDEDSSYFWSRARRATSRAPY